eukprot:GHVU01150850.1.p2 GENE.GHVU01150850.1~~GHVU01150850.1.p2  ORF type:complete len:110 (+),score=26.52 GHVU01150850.1:474-803(+)
MYSVNLRFAPLNRKVVVSQIHLFEEGDDGEAGAVEGRVSEDRSQILEAQIVRIMKMQRSLSEAALVKQVQTSLSFNAGEAAVKERIESLLDKEFLERDPKTSSLLHYVA